MSVSVVVPVYNSAGTLGTLVSRLEPVLDATGDLYELILVNDGSLDRSWEIAVQLAAQHDWIVVINLMRNYGQHNALLCGIRAARCDTIVTMDDDLQNPPEEIPKLLAELHKGYDVIYGTPIRQQHGLWRNLASTATKLTLQGAMGARTARQVSAFRAFRAQARDAFADYRGAFVSIDTLLTWGTTKFCAVPVRHEPRRVGASNYTFRKLLAHSLNMMTGFGTLPLRFATYIGFAFTLVGLAVLAYVIFRYFRAGDAVPGFPFLASIIAIFSGAQLFALGIFGEYLARVFVRITEAPPYIVRDAIGRKNRALPARGEYSPRISRAMEAD
jgi:undecaprenyl-phosphate 4-deoxy-4-formamido-L-arabinose transferase